MTRFDICIHFEIIAIIKLINMSITSQSYLTVSLDLRKDGPEIP